MEELKRVTPATADALEVLLHASEPVWGRLIVKATGRPAGSVYPILERLERLGWLASNWEGAGERGGPRRRFYHLTDAGAVAAPAVIAKARARARRGSGRIAEAGT